MKLAYPILSVACLVPLFYAWVTRRAQDQDRAHALAAFGALSTLAVTIGCVVMYVRAGTEVLVEASVPLVGSHIHYQMGLDPLSAPLVLLVSTVVAAMVLGAPRRELSGAMLSSLLLTEGFTLAMFTARDLVVFSVCWAAAFWPMSRWKGEGVHAARARRVLVGMAIASSVPLAVAVVWLGLTDRTLSAGVYDMLALHTLGVPSSVQTPIFVLVTLAALVRMGIVPFHSWLPAIWRGAPLPIAIMTVVAPAGLYLLARFGLPLLPRSVDGRVPLVADLALASALYGALLALGQHDLKRMLGSLAISQSGLMLIGLSSTNAQGETGAVLLCLGDRVALCGLFLTVWQVRVRTGESDVRKLGGLAHTMPRLTGAFLLFALGTMAAPGTLGFIAEDLVIGGIIETYPWISVVVVVTTALNGVTLLRAFSKVFLGPARDPRIQRGLLPDLTLGQRWVTATLMAFLVLMGAMPHVLTHTAQAATIEMQLAPPQRQGVPH